MYPSSFLHAVLSRFHYGSYYFLPGLYTTLTYSTNQSNLAFPSHTCHICLVSAWWHVGPFIPGIAETKRRTKQSVHDEKRQNRME